MCPSFIIIRTFWILKSVESLIIIAIGIFPIKQENLFSFSFFNLARNLFFYFFFFFLLSLSHPTLAGVDDKTVKSVVRCSRAATARRLDSGVRVGCKCKTKQVLRAKLLAFSLLPPHDKYRKKNWFCYFDFTRLPFFISCRVTFPFLPTSEEDRLAYNSIQLESSFLEMYDPKVKPPLRITRSSVFPGPTQTQKNANQKK